MINLSVWIRHREVWRFIGQSWARFLCSCVPKRHITEPKAESVAHLRSEAVPGSLSLFRLRVGTQYPYL
ncbi:hypothetical protein J6590_045988 [Homalodisca vitripennis]|nr:hypothetical protein J6590_045988 [Homalodisca vitripennis]